MLPPSRKELSWLWSKWDSRVFRLAAARSEIRREASGEEPETDDGTMRLRVEPDGVHLGDDVLSPTELRERVREARRVAGELHAIIEAADGVPTPEVQGILEMLREEHVSVAP